MNWKQGRAGAALADVEVHGLARSDINDVNNWLVSQGQTELDVLEGFWGDAGESIDAYYDVNDFVRANRANHAEPEPD